MTERFPTIRARSVVAIFGPGILVAATGVGAGDLATGAMAGSKLGLAILWAVLLGAGLKFLVNEGLARWQLATGETILEGAVTHLGRPVQWCFLGYLLIWSFAVGSALMGACGVTVHAMLPLTDAPTDKIIYGIFHSVAAIALVKIGGYRLFQKIMSVCIAFMFVVVVAAAVAVKPSWSQIGLGLITPSIPDVADRLWWTAALIGGVGGTLTVLCYGYWIREEGRQSPEMLRTCRIDLAVGYAMTAIFGVSMVVIASRIPDLTGRGASLIVEVSDRLELSLGGWGPVLKWAFLVGAWSAVFSSLLGVWQSVPYIFADFWRLAVRVEGDPKTTTVNTAAAPYQVYLFAIGVIPIVGLTVKFETVQLGYAVIGALFIPMLAVVLLILNGQSRYVGRQFRNSPLTSLLLCCAIVLFLLFGWMTVRDKIEKYRESRVSAKTALKIDQSSAVAAVAGKKGLARVEPLQPKQARVDPGALLIYDHVGQHLADRRADLEGVSASARRQPEAGMGIHRSENGMPVRRDGI
jgi:Mn2+/Fe2+ NRAMP family transporter